MPIRYHIKLASTSLLYHIRNEHNALICKLSVHDGVIVGVFIDGGLPAELEESIRGWAKKAMVECPQKIDILGVIHKKDTWEPARR